MSVCKQRGSVRVSPLRSTMESFLEGSGVVQGPQLQEGGFRADRVLTLGPGEEPRRVLRTSDLPSC